MSTKTSTISPQPTIDQQFDALRSALIPHLAYLSPEQQAALAAIIDEQIDLTHQAVLDQVRAVEEKYNTVNSQSETSAPVETFDDSIYQQKILALHAFATDIKYTPAKNLPRDTDWTRTLEYFKHKLGKFFKVAFINAENRNNGQKWLQAILIQEFDQYDKHSCNKETGENVLPVRLRNGQLEAAITLRNPPGSFGQTVFCAPRCSTSNPQKTAFCDQPTTFWTKLQRSDSNRMTGRTSNKVIYVDHHLESQINPNEEKIVWFTVPELKRLLEEPQMEDSPTITLVQWVLLHAQKLQEMIASA